MCTFSPNSSKTNDVVSLKSLSGSEKGLTKIMIDKQPLYSKRKAVTERRDPIPVRFDIDNS